MSEELKAKLRELDLEFLPGIPVHLTDAMIAQIDQAYEGAGWRQLPQGAELDALVEWHDGRLLTGQEWYGRFVKELPPQGLDTVLVDGPKLSEWSIRWLDVEKAAKKASGIK